VSLRISAQSSIAEHEPLRRQLEAWLARARAAGLSHTAIDAPIRTTVRDAVDEERWPRSSGPMRWANNIGTPGAMWVNVEGPARARGRTGRPERRGQLHPCSNSPAAC